jgi:hypothetical protein
VPLTESGGLGRALQCPRCVQRDTIERYIVVGNSRTNSVSKVVEPSQLRTTSSIMNQEIQPGIAPSEMFSSQSATNAAQVRKLSPPFYNHQRLQIRNISEVSRGIQALTSEDGHKDQEILSWSLSRAVFYAQLDMAGEGKRPD